jgi:cardiolipin synthase
VTTANVTAAGIQAFDTVTTALQDSVDSGAFAQQVADMLARDFADSTPAAAHELDRAGFWFRLKVRVARLMAPVQ